ncbi:UDP-glucosyltransferase 2 isoform X1 [Solenopsis invicta]|uniref:UDP-glucosyltransferase 2 isoform X1 n=2 Tax=Solenopsis invicta TaxID=13686 RepID=UPI00193D4A43|nr:UDP-glucosyltransferase 2 isoform X1 [Solenopsis invicta]
MFRLKVIKNYGKMRVLPLIFLWLSYLSFCNGYRLLALFPLQVKSHFVMFEPLMKGLVRKGHQIDVVTSFPLKKPYPNYTDIVTVPITLKLVNNMSYEMMNNLISENQTHVVGTIGGNDLCKLLADSKIKELAQPKNPPYDAVLMEVFGAQCLGIIAYLLKVPLIGVSTTSLYPWLHQMVGQPENLAFVPNNMLTFTAPMNFWQRLYNVLRTLYDKWLFHYMTTREQTRLIRENFGPDMPGVRELERKVSLILINSHITLNGIHPTTPAVVDVGGLHVYTESETLQPELKKWMDDSKDGFIYFTFGSMVMIETFPREFLKILYASLGKIAPVRILMKIPAPEKLPPGLPENIHVSPWMPQLKILKHPNIRAFITHGGLMGTQEAVSCGVPMIGLPLFADQFTNINAYVARNIAIRLDVKTLTEKSMDAALNAILQDPLYRESARNLSQRFLDRPLDAIDTANYWIEYVIRYGENSLRSPAVDMTWWQLSLVDVIGFLLFCAVLIIALIVFIVQFMFKLMHKGVNTLYSRKLKAN